MLLVLLFVGTINPYVEYNHQVHNRQPLDTYCNTIHCQSIYVSHSEAESMQYHPRDFIVLLNVIIIKSCKQC